MFQNFKALVFKTETECCVFVSPCLQVSNLLPFFSGDKDVTKSLEASAELSRYMPY